MTLVVPHTWTAGDDATSTNLQTLTDGIKQLQGGTPTGSGTALDFFTAVQTVAQTGLTASTFVSITFPTEIFDVAGGHSTVSNTSRYVGKTAGYYEIGGMVAFAAGAGARRIVHVALNGTAVDGTEVSTPPHANGMGVGLPSGIVVALNGTTDYVEIQGFSDVASWATLVSGSASSRLTVRYIHS